ncbi:hypothetical protein GCM10017602_04350 [Herbiconiux flava]|nr:hypothetical protein GCM10017602_04350 [Herbiconiux flava]
MAEALDTTPTKGEANSAPPAIVARTAFSDLEGDSDMDLLDERAHTDAVMLGAARNERKTEHFEQVNKEKLNDCHPDGGQEAYRERELHDKGRSPPLVRIPHAPDRVLTTRWSCRPSAHPGDIARID